VAAGVDTQQFRTLVQERGSSPEITVARACHEAAAGFLFDLSRITRMKEMFVAVALLARSHWRYRIAKPFQDHHIRRTPKLVSRVEGGEYAGDGQATVQKAQVVADPKAVGRRSPSPP